MTTSGSALAAYTLEVESFVETSCRSYIDRLSLQTRRSFSKEFNDPVWGTLTLSGLEVCLLDSPVLQRLRRIRQLGLAHYIYPAATHARFEHSLGVMHQVENLIAAMNRSSAGSVDLPYSRLLRIAALCHDVGHGVMSHVSENALRYNEETNDVITGFKQAVGRAVKLGEVSTYLILGSHAFGDLLHASEQASQEHIEVPDVQRKLQDITIGKQVHDKLPLLQELISGPFDADKLDYMARDAYFSGVPAITDVNRLTHKLRTRTLSRSDLPESLASRLNPTTEELVTVLAVARSGNRTLDELTLGRVLLADKIYRHHKLRSAEAIVASILLQLSKGDGLTNSLALIALRMTDDELINLDHLHGWNGFSTTMVAADSAVVLSDLVGRLRDRRLFVRAGVFAQSMPGDPFADHLPHTDGLEVLIRHLSDPPFRLEYAERIASDAEEAIRLVDQEDLLSEVPGGSLLPYVWIDPPATVDNPSTMSTALLLDDAGSIVSYKEESPETENWATAYAQTRDVGFVFTTEEVVFFVTLATERRLREDYQVRMPLAMVPASPPVRPEEGLNARDALKRRLANAGFYEDYPPDLLPLPLRLHVPDAMIVFKKIADRLRGYVGPSADLEAMRDHPFGILRLREFVAQFKDDQLVDAAMRMLNNVRFLHPHEVAEALRHFLADHPALRNSAIVPLGEPKDSSAIAAYVAKSVKRHYPNVGVMDLGSALSLKERPLLFIDDACFSGAQSSAIVSAWFGDTERAEALGEDRLVLPQGMGDVLKQRQVGFLFVSGTAPGLTALKGVLAEYELLEPVLEYGIDIDALPTLTTVEYESGEQQELFVSKCTEIGLKLGEMRGDGRAEERALGYGNRGLLLVLPYNTPAQTVRCLWESSRQGYKWEALFPRLRKE